MLRPVSAHAMLSPVMNPTYFALNKTNKTVAVILGATWDEIRLRSLFGLAMPDNTVASGIGRFPGTIDGVKAAATKQGMTFIGTIDCNA